MTPKHAVDSFLLLTDLHFWEIVLNPLELLNKRAIGVLNVALHRRKEFLIDRAESYADAVADAGIKDVIISGDLSSTATEREFAMGAEFVRRLERSGLRVTVIPGNHDVYTFESLRKRRFEEYFGEWLPSDRLPALRTLPGGTSVLYVPTVCANWLSSRGRITDAEIQATSEALAALHSRVVVVGHYPLLEQTYGYKAGGGRRLRNAGALRDALGRSGLEILYLCGHVHRFSYVQDEIYPNMSHLTSGAFFRNDPRSDAQGDFSQIGVGEDGFEVIRHLYTGEWVASREERHGG